MNALLEQVLESREFTNSKNEKVQVYAHTMKSQCEFLQKIIARNKYSKSLEIGFACGISALAITESISNNGGKHFVIDKFQNTDWNGNGLELMRLSGYSDKFEFSDKYCYEVLPELLAQGRKFDFAYIDTTKQFDWILIDFFYIDKLLETNGVIVFDDVFCPGIRKALRYITQFPNYRIYGQFPENFKISKIRKTATILKYLPGANKFIKHNLIKTDYEMGLNTNCLAIQKVGNDERRWDWHVDF